MKVLIADDDQDVREVLSEALKEENFKVDVVENGLDAFELIKRKIYDVIITDYQMPKMSGMELVGLIKGGSPNRYTPCIILSGALDETVRARFNYLNVADMLSKPVYLDDIMNVIKQKTCTENFQGKVAPEVLECFKKSLEIACGPFIENKLEIGEPELLRTASKTFFCGCMMAVYGRRINGSVCLTLSEELVTHLVEKTFEGITIENLADHAELVCELANQTLGEAKRELAKINLFITIGVPVQYATEPFNVEHFVSGVRTQIKFSLDGHPGFIEFCIGKSSYENWDQPDGGQKVFV